MEELLEELRAIKKALQTLCSILYVSDSLLPSYEKIAKIVLEKDLDFLHESLKTK